MKVEIEEIILMSIMPALTVFAYLFTKLCNFIEKKYDENN